MEFKAPAASAVWLSALGKVGFLPFHCVNNVSTSPSYKGCTQRSYQAHNVRKKVLDADSFITVKNVHDDLVDLVHQLPKMSIKQHAETNNRVL